MNRVVDPSGQPPQSPCASLRFTQQIEMDLDICSRIQKIKNILRFCLLLDENSVLIGCNKFGLDFFARSAIFLTVTLYSYLSIKGPSIKHACVMANVKSGLE